MSKFNNFDWPGWPLDNNPYGEQFDADARQRMFDGSNALVPFFKNYSSSMGSNILEVGPFFSPLITSEQYPEANIFYWENDHHVLKYLSKKYEYQSVYPIYCDFNRVQGDYILELRKETQRCFVDSNIKRPVFDSIIVSHVLNYSDYKLLFFLLKDFLRDGGLVFINNVVDYGLPEFFSEKRPESIEGTLDALDGFGYHILEQEILESPDAYHQKNKRLVLVAAVNKQ